MAKFQFSYIDAVAVEDDIRKKRASFALRETYLAKFQGVPLENLNPIVASDLAAFGNSLSSEEQDAIIASAERAVMEARERQVVIAKIEGRDTKPEEDAVAAALVEVQKVK